jgi:hypothetical protein
MKLYVLNGGTLGPYDKSHFFYGRDLGKKIMLPVWQAYREHKSFLLTILRSMKRLRKRRHIMNETAWGW